ncbi:hypothetical protein D3C72_554720 [compost metagenome]
MASGEWSTMALSRAVSSSAHSGAGAEAACASVTSTCASSNGSACMVTAVYAPSARRSLTARSMHVGACGPAARAWPEAA